MSFRPMLKPGVRIPFGVTRRCPYCYRDARAQIAYPQGSLVVNFTRDFYLVCVNRFCPQRFYREPQPCMLRHRNFELSDMVIEVRPEVGLPVERVTRKIGRRRVGHEIPDFEHEYFRETVPAVQRGPYRACPGSLDWDGSLGVSRETWLRCNVCHARYHAIILVDRGVTPRNLDAYTHFNEFRLELNALTGEPVRAVKANGRTGRNIIQVPRDLAVFIDGCEIREGGPPLVVPTKS